MDREIGPDREEDPPQDYGYGGSMPARSWGHGSALRRSNAGCEDANENVADHTKGHDGDGDPNPTGCLHDDY